MGMKSSVIKALSAPVLQWKTTPGNPYVDEDEVIAQHNAIIFVYSPADTSVNIHLPKITAASAGQRIEVVNQLQLKDDMGNVILIADDDDFVESTSPLDFFMYPNSTFEKAHFWLMSDGVNRWSFHFPNGGNAPLAPT